MYIFGFEVEQLTFVVLSSICVHAAHVGACASAGVCAYMCGSMNKNRKKYDKTETNINNISTSLLLISWQKVIIMIAAKIFLSLISTRMRRARGGEANRHLTYFHLLTRSQPKLHTQGVDLIEHANFIQELCP